jgi:hypothetical protein
MELLHLDIGAVSNVGPEVSDPQADETVALGYGCGAMLMGEEREPPGANSWSSGIDINSSNGISRPNPPNCGCPRKKALSVIPASIGL